MIRILTRGLSSGDNVRLIAPTQLYLFTVITCYFFYPSWQLISSSVNSVVTAWIYLLIVVALLKQANSYLNSENELSSLPIAHRLQINEVLLIGIVLSTFVALHWKYLNWPFLSGPDEPIIALFQLIQVRNFLSDGFQFYLGLFVIATIALYAIANRMIKSHTAHLASRHVIQRFVLLSVILLLAMIVWSYLVTESNSSWGTMVRWPPVGTVFSLISQSIFGSNEFSARLPSLLFSLGTGFYLFLILRGISGNKAAAILAVVYCLSAPVFFHFSQLDFREVGGTFFMTAGVFYLIRHLDIRRPDDLVYAMICVALGYLERRTAVMLIFIIIGPILMFSVLPAIKNKAYEQLNHGIRFYLINLVLVTAAILPWMIISQEVRPYKFHFDNFLEWKYLAAYPALLPKVVGWPLLVFALTGAIYSIWVRSRAGIVAISWLIIAFILFTGDIPYYIPEPRFTVIVVPALAILSGVAFSQIRLIRYKNISYALILLVGLIPLASWKTDRPLLGIFPETASTLLDMPYYPFEDLILSLDKKPLNTGRLAFPAFWQSAASVYLKLHNIEGYTTRAVRHKAIPWNERAKSIESLYHMCLKNNCDAVVLAFNMTKESSNVLFMTDITGQDILKKKIAKFNVVGLYSHKNNWLALLTPLY